MAEFCKDCFEKLLPDWIVTTTSNDVDLCEGCGEWKQVVIEAGPINAGEELMAELEKYRHAAFIISETCVEASKQHITPEAALQRIRENIYLGKVCVDENKVLYT